MVASKLPDNDEGESPNSFKTTELMTYTEAKKSANPRPYIAAVITPSGFTELFTLGDGKNTSYPTSRRRRSTSSYYHNGPLEPDQSYRIFQRIFTGKVRVGA